MRLSVSCLLHGYIVFCGMFVFEYLGGVPTFD